MISTLPQSIPRWVIIIAILHLLAALIFGVLAHVDSSNQFPDLVLNDDANFAVGLYANRNIGVAVALAAALALRSRLMLAGLFLARLVTDAGDFVMALTQNPESNALVGQLIFFGLLFASEVAVIRALVNLENEGAAP